MRLEPTRGRLAALVLVCATAACRSPIGVDDTGFDDTYRSLRENVLDSDEPSNGSRQFLAYFALDGRYDDDPAGTIAAFEKIVARDRNRGLAACLAELHYHLALEQHDRGRFLASAAWAWIYLFGTQLEPEPNPFAPAYRLACDLYNRALARALLEPDGSVALRDGTQTIPEGSLALSFADGTARDLDRFERLVPADAFEVRGLATRVRRYGLGVPLIAVPKPEASTSGRAANGLHVPATALLTVDGDLADLANGSLKGTLELRVGLDAESTTVGGRRIPLESDPTAALAHSLESSRLWDFSLRGFFGKSDDAFHPGIYPLEPYKPGKIPLLLIHGTASNPAAWTPMINGLIADPRIRANYQIWLAIYNTGNPILYTARVLRSDLAALLREVDPGGSDPALRRMVIAGHSQGGLLTRLLVTHSGDRFWRNVGAGAFDESKVAPESRELLRSCMFFEPLPFVERVVFLSTPHQGAYVVGGWLAGLVRKLVDLPGEVTGTIVGLFKGSDLPPELEKGVPTSVDNMERSSPFVQALRELPIAPGVHVHSIVAVDDDGPPEEGNDGVVEYRSAHLADAESELVVRSGHSSQVEPAAIVEVRRILIDHAAAKPR